MLRSDEPLGGEDRRAFWLPCDIGRTTHATEHVLSIPTFEIGTRSEVIAREAIAAIHLRGPDRRGTICDGPCPTRLLDAAAYGETALPTSALKSERWRRRE